MTPRLAVVCSSLLTLAGCAEPKEADPHADTADTAPGPDTADTDTAPPPDSGESGETGETGDTGEPPAPAWTDACEPPPAPACASSGSASPWVRLTADAASVVIPGEETFQGVVSVGDLDGDGGAELAIAGVGGLRVFRGADVVAGRVDAPLATCEVDAWVGAGSAVGDLDGDGLAELFGQSMTVGADDAGVGLFFGADLAAGVCAPEWASTYAQLSVHPVGDVDGDGLAEAWIYSSSGDAWQLTGWDGRLVAQGPSVAPSAFGPDLDGDGVRDFAQGLAQVTEVPAWSGADGADLGTHALAPWYRSTWHDVRSLEPAGGPGCEQALFAADDRAVYRARADAWSGDGSAIPLSLVAVDPAVVADELTPVGDLDGDGLSETAWHAETDAGDVCFLEGRHLDGTVRGRDGLRCIAGTFDRVTSGDLDGDGLSDLVLHHVPTEAWPYGATLVLRGEAWEDCDCDADGTLSATCGGLDVADDDPSRSGAVREDPGNGADDDGDGAVDETAGSTGSAGENAWALFVEEAGAAVVDGVLLDDGDADGIPDPALAAAWDWAEPGSLVTAFSGTLGSAREVGLAADAGLVLRPEWLGAWNGGPVAWDAGDVTVWSPPAPDGTLTVLATVPFVSGLRWEEPDAGGDVDGDGIPDLLMTRAMYQYGDHCLVDGAALLAGGTVGGCARFSVELAWQADEGRLGDLDGDGLAEVVTRHEQETFTEGSITVRDAWILVAPATGGDVLLTDGWHVDASSVRLLAPTDGDGDGYADLVLHGDVGLAEGVISVVRGGALPAAGFGAWEDTAALVVEDPGAESSAVTADGRAVLAGADEDLYLLDLSGTGRVAWADAAVETFDAPHLGVADARAAEGALWVLATTRRATVSGAGALATWLFPLPVE